MLFVSLLTVPFHAASGATGLHCAAGTVNARALASLPGTHDSEAPGDHHPDMGAPGAYDDPVAEPASHESDGLAGAIFAASVALRGALLGGQMGQVTRDSMPTMPPKPDPRQ